MLPLKETDSWLPCWITAKPLFFRSNSLIGALAATCSIALRKSLLPARGMKLVLGVYLALMVVHVVTGFSALGWHAPATVLSYFVSLPKASSAFGFLTRVFWITPRLKSEVSCHVLTRFRKLERTKGNRGRSAVTSNSFRDLARTQPWQAVSVSNLTITVGQRLFRLILDLRTDNRVANGYSKPWLTRADVTRLRATDVAAAASYQMFELEFLTNNQARISHV